MWTHASPPPPLFSFSGWTQGRRELPRRLEKQIRMGTVAGEQDVKAHSSSHGDQVDGERWVTRLKSQKMQKKPAETRRAAWTSWIGSLSSKVQRMCWAGCTADAALRGGYPAVTEELALPAHVCGYHPPDGARRGVQPGRVCSSTCSGRTICPSCPQRASGAGCGPSPGFSRG